MTALRRRQIALFYLPFVLGSCNSRTKPPINPDNPSWLSLDARNTLLASSAAVVNSFVDLTDFDNEKDRPSLDFFQGYDRFEQLSREKCVEGAKPNPTSAASVSGNWDGHVSESESEFATRSSMSLSASLGIGYFSASANYKTVATAEASERSIIAIVRASAEEPSEGIPEAPRLLREYKDLLDRGDVPQFLARCGDSYVSSVTYGALYEARYEFLETKATEQTATAANLRASINILTGPVGGSAEASFENMAASIINQKGTRQSIIYIGHNPSGAVKPGEKNDTESFCPNGALQHAPMTLHEVLQFGSDIACRVKSTGKRPVLRWGLNSYEGLHKNAPSFDNSLDTGINVQRLMALYARRGSLRLASKHPEMFGGDFFEKKQALAEEDQLSRTIEALQREYIELSKKKQDSDRRSFAAAFQRKLVSETEGIKPPLHRSNLHNDATLVQRPGLHEIIKRHDGTYELRLVWTGTIALDKALAIRCPYSCVPNMEEGVKFHFMGPGGQHQVRRISYNDPVGVPEGWGVFFELQDGGGAEGYKDNSWIGDKSGILAFEYIP